VEAICDEITGKTFLRGTETADENRANLFGVWRDAEPDPDSAFDDDEFDDSGVEYNGRYCEAHRDGGIRVKIGVEVEVRHAFAAHEDIDDHAEVYLWQTYHWKLTGDGPICQKDETFAGEYVVEAGGLDGPFAIFSPLVGAAVQRIQRARWDKEIIPPRVVGERSGRSNGTPGGDS